MKRILVNELKRAFVNRIMLLVIVMETLLVIVYTVQEVLPVYYVSNPFRYSVIETGKVRGILGTYYTWIGFSFSQCQTIMFTILPLIAALPYGSSLYYDEKKRYVENILIRCRRKDYYIAKAIAIFVTGGVVATYPLVLSLVINAAYLPFERIVPELSWFTVKGVSVLAELFYKAPIVYVIIYILVTFVSFGILNCLCIPASYIFANGFVIMAVPFTVYYGSFVVCSFLGKKSASLWLSMRFSYLLKNDALIVICTFILIIVLISISLVARIRRHSDIL